VKNFNINFKWQIHYTEITNLLHSAIHFRKIPPSTSIHFAIRALRSRVFRLSLSSPFFLLSWQQRPKCERAIRQFVWCIHLSFVHYVPRPSKQRSKEVRAGDCSSCIWLTFITKPTCSHQLFSYNDVHYLPKQLHCSWFTLWDDSAVLYELSVPYKNQFYPIQSTSYPVRANSTLRNKVLGCISYFDHL
jgi:hypothetical protein